MYKTWKQINNIIRPNRIYQINIMNKMIENYITFVKIGKHISKWMSCLSHCQYIKDNYINSLFFVPVTSVDVQEIIISLNNTPGKFNILYYYFEKTKAPHFSCIVSYQFVITNWYFFWVFKISQSDSTKMVIGLMLSTIDQYRC